MLHLSLGVVVVVVCCSDSDGGGGGRDINNYDDILGLHVKVLKLGFLNRVRQTFNSSLQCIVMYNTKQ
jgi:hypothetical protein